VQAFFDESGQLVPHETLVYPREGESADTGEILLHALGLAAMNEQLEVMAFLLNRGADINGPWGLHEPASVLHEAAANGRMQAICFLVDHGADLTTRDQRYNAMPHEWAYYCGQEEAHAFLEPLANARLDDRT